MSQSDLAVKNELAYKNQNMEALVVGGISESKEIVLDFIPVEVYAFIAAREADKSTAKCPFNCMELDAASVSLSQDRFEPARSLKDFSPPTRFFRRFRKSESGQIFACLSNQTMEG